MARGHLVFALSIILSFRHSILPSHQSLSSQLLHPSMDLNETWQGCCTTSLEVHVWRWLMFGKFWQSYGPWMSLRIFTHFSLSSQLLLHPCMDLNETFVKFWQSYDPWLLEFLHNLACLLNSSYNKSTSLHGFEWYLAGMLHHKSRSACGEIIHVRQILAELWSLTLRIFTQFSLSSQLLLHPYMDLNETWQGCRTTSREVHAVSAKLCGTSKDIWCC